MGFDTVFAVVLAAGKGTRMAGDMPKVLVCLNEKPLLGYVLDAVESSGISKNNTIVVVGYEHEKVVDYLGGAASWVLQKEQLGTGHAVMACSGMLSSFVGTIVILCGDAPLVSGQMIRTFCQQHLETGAVCSVLTAQMRDPHGYGRIIRGSDGGVERIVEEKETDEETSSVTEINTGVFCFNSHVLFEILPEIDNLNTKGEYYLTDAVKILIESGRPVQAVMTDASDRMIGINTKDDLDKAARIISEMTA